MTLDRNLKPYDETKIPIKLTTWAIIKVTIIVTVTCNSIFYSIVVQETNASNIISLCYLGHTMYNGVVL